MQDIAKLGQKKLWPPNLDFRSVIRKYFLPLAVSLGISLILLEGLARIVRPESLKDIYSDGPERMRYAYDDTLGWSSVPSVSYEFKGSRRVRVSNNTLGFRDDEWNKDGRPRVLVLGDSYVWGYDVEKEERFTEFLAGSLPSLRFLNAGIAGFGTDQELLLMERFFEAADPAIVILIYAGTNDSIDNSSNFSNGAFKPYYTMQKGALIQNGVPVPESLLFRFRRHPQLFQWSSVARGAAGIAIRFQSGIVTVPDPTLALVAAMREFVTSRGRQFVLGYENASPDLVASFDAAGLSPVNLITAKRYPGDGTHWTPEGHREVMEKLLPVLRAKLRGQDDRPR